MQEVYDGYNYTYYFRRPTTAVAGTCKTIAYCPEELLRVSVEELIARPQADFQKALGYVLEKNKELYKRLA